MDCTATPNTRVARVEQGFERSRLSEEILASAYERLLPLVRRMTGLPQKYPQQRHAVGQLRQARRA
jgi:hypothetical protein